MAMKVFEMVVCKCECGCGATKLGVKGDHENKSLAQVSSVLHEESKEVREAFVALAEAIGNHIIRAQGCEPLKMVVTAPHELN